MLRFWKKKAAEEEESHPKEKHKPTKSGSGKAMLEAARTGLNSQWFNSKRFCILKEFENESHVKGVIDDRGKERAIGSTLTNLEGAFETLIADDDQDGAREAADLFLLAYTKMGNPKLLDSHSEACARVNVSEDEIKAKLLEAANQSHQIDIAVTLYSRVGAKEKLTEAGNKALSLYLEADELDIKSRSRLFDYVVEAYKSADDMESLIHAGDKALKSQIEGRRLSREPEWVLDAQKAYEAAGDKGKIAKLGDQYMNLYLKEGLEIWLDKAVATYKEAEIDVVSKLSKLADKIEEKGQSGIADTIRSKLGQ